MKLQIEMIPRPNWGKSLSKKLKKSDWDSIRKAVYAKENMKCHICEEDCQSLHAHEVWNFDEERHVQKLVDIIGICSACHNTIHYGRAQRIGKAREAQEQFLKVNDCLSFLEFQTDLNRASEDFHRRSKIEDWKIDVSFIEQQGYVVKIE